MVRVWRAQMPAGLRLERPMLPYTFCAAALVSSPALSGSSWIAMSSSSPPTSPPAVCSSGSSQRPSAWWLARGSLSGATLPP